LGADEVLDYRATRFEERVRDMDAVLGAVYVSREGDF